MYHRQRKPILRYREVIEYKGYKIQLYFSVKEFSKYVILKDNIEIRVSSMMGADHNKLTSLATDYIDKYADRLEAKLQKIKIANNAVKIY